jgi:cysteinyl-tRNA synthetase
MLRLLDTAGRQLSEVPRRESGELGLYVCGPTVYAPPHVGHGRTMLVYDVMRRYLEHRGVPVRHVCNVTDIDDKIIQRAEEDGRGWKEVSAENEELWWQAADKLGLLRPHEIPHATDYVPEMAELVAELVSDGAAYAAEDGVYFSVAAVPGYGLLPHQDPDELRAGARVEAAESKRAPADFALWKAAKPGEPSWDSPFGPGRPGWHTECVVMSLSLLGEGFSLHGGGQDLVFPHHENERAQAVALGRDFARVWVHNGLVTERGEKMSKSLGNTLGLEELLGYTDPRAYRMLVLRSHYRSPLEVLPGILEDAARMVERVETLARRLEPLSAGSAGGATAPADGAPDALRDAFYGAMDDDLDTPAAVATLFEGVRRANGLVDEGDAAGAVALGGRALELFAALGLRVTGSEPPPPHVAELARRRDAARSRGDYGEADRLRQDIERLGWRAEDTAGGTRLRRGERSLWTGAAGRDTIA